MQYLVGSKQTACAVCKYWNDPTNSAIKPKMKNLWIYDMDAKNICLRRGVERKVNYACNDFECKLPYIK